MKTQLTPRLEHSITVLYNAFHNGTLNAFKCKACAVGNIVGHGDWYICDAFGIPHGVVRKINSFPLKYPINPYYSDEEIFNIEKTFLMEWAKEKSLNGLNKEIQFKGLCAVIEYLCKLDGVEDIMDYTKLFEEENNEPKYELNF